MQFSNASHLQIDFAGSVVQREGKVSDSDDVRLCATENENGETFKTSLLRLRDTSFVFQKPSHSGRPSRSEGRAVGNSEFGVPRVTSVLSRVATGSFQWRSLAARMVGWADGAYWAYAEDADDADDHQDAAEWEGCRALFLFALFPRILSFCVCQNVICTDTLPANSDEMQLNAIHNIDNIDMDICEICEYEYLNIIIIILFNIYRCF